jgi:hypothetical protein
VEEKRAAVASAAAEAEINKLYAESYPDPSTIAAMETLVFSTGESVERSTPSDKKKNKKKK